MHGRVAGLASEPLASRIESRARHVRAGIFRRAHGSGIAVARAVLPAYLRVDRSSRHVREDFVFSRLVDGSGGIYARTRKERRSHSSVYDRRRAQKVAEQVRTVSSGIHVSRFVVREVHALSVEDGLRQVRRNGDVEGRRGGRLESRSRRYRVNESGQDVLIRRNVIARDVCHVSSGILRRSRVRRIDRIRQRGTVLHAGGNLVRPAVLSGRIHVKSPGFRVFGNVRYPERSGDSRVELVLVRGYRRSGLDLGSRLRLRVESGVFAPVGREASLDERHVSEPFEVVSARKIVEISDEPQCRQYRHDGDDDDEFCKGKPLFCSMGNHPRGKRR